MTMFQTLLPALAVSLLLTSQTALAELPTVQGAHLVQPPPGSNVAAAYFTLSNTGSDALSITDVSSTVAAKTELHLSKVENDVAKMIKQDEILIQAGESLEFRRGSYHIMFMGLNEAPVAGNIINIVLQTSAGDLPIEIPVLTMDEAADMGTGGAHGGHSMNHSNHKMDHGKHSGEHAMDKPTHGMDPEKEHNHK